MKHKNGIIGGVRIGGWNATYPFAALSVNEDHLRLKVLFVAPFIFPAERVLSVERYVCIPFIGWGIKIRHDIGEYPGNIVFWYLGFPETVLAFISASGFSPKLINK